MTKKISLLAVSACAIVAAGAGAATIKLAPSAGPFTGTTSQHHPLSFTVAPTRNRIPGEKTKLEFKCPDGSAGGFTVSHGVPVRVRNGAFSGTVKGSSSKGHPYTMHLVGRFSSRTRASGTISLTITYPDSGACTSGVVSWSAKHR